MLETFISDLKLWASKPYDDEMNLFHWVLFVGLWVCAAVLWSRIIKALVD